jgi:murein L,D-transpeptidase YafK
MRRRRKIGGKKAVLVKRGNWRAVLLLGAILAGDEALAVPKHAAPIPGATMALMEGKGLSPASPILIRTFKKEAELEIWKQGRDGRFVRLKVFPICRWSGQLGPKTTLGDRQVPEGFYAVTPAQMNPNSSFHLSFDIGYPNAYDRAHGGSGAHLMVHGACSSSGCFAMTDRGVSEIYAIVREAFAGGQQALQLQSYPFRMTAENMAKHRDDKHIAFWRQLKEGFDRFEATREEVAVGVGFGPRYVFAAAKDVSTEALVRDRRAREEAAIAALSRKKPAVMTTYVDGGQHKSLQKQAKRGAFGPVSQPQALAEAGREVVIGGEPKAPPVAETKMAAAQRSGKGATKTKAAPSPAPAPATERPFYRRFFDVLTPTPAEAASSGRT